MSSKQLCCLFTLYSFWNRPQTNKHLLCTFISVTKRLAHYIGDPYWKHQPYQPLWNLASAFLQAHIGSFIYMASAKRLQTKRTRFQAMDWQVWIINQLIKCQRQQYYNKFHLYIYFSIKLNNDESPGIQIILKFIINSMKSRPFRLKPFGRLLANVRS